MTKVMETVNMIIMMMSTMIMTLMSDETFKNNIIIDQPRQKGARDSFHCIVQEVSILGSVASGCISLFRTITHWTRRNESPVSVGMVRFGKCFYSRSASLL